MLPWDSYRLSHVLCINHPIYLLLVSIQITLWYPQGDQCLFPKTPQTDTTREANPSKTRPNSLTLGLTNSCRTQLPSGFLQYLSVLDTEQKGKTDLLNVKVDHHRIWDSQESESEKKADGVGFQLSSWTESNLPSEPLSMKNILKSSASYLTNKPPPLHWSHPSLLILDSPCHLHVHHSLPLRQLVSHTAQVQRSTVLFLLLDSAFYSTSMLTKFLSQGNRVANYTTLYILSLSTKMKGCAKPGAMVYTCNSSTEHRRQKYK